MTHPSGWWASRAARAGLVSPDNGLSGASGDVPLTGLPWRRKQLERVRLRYSCRATCQCATATRCAMDQRTDQVVALDILQA